MPSHYHSASSTRRRRDNDRNQNTTATPPATPTATATPNNNNNKKKTKNASSTNNRKNRGTRNKGRGTQGFKRVRAEGDGSFSPSIDCEEDIESQLQRQRLKQRERESENVTSTQQHQPQHATTTSPPTIMGDFRYDRTKKAYFPKSSFPIIDTDIHLEPLLSAQLPPSSASHLWYATSQTCASARIRTRMRSLCAARHMVEQLQLIPTAIPAAATISNQNRRLWHTMLTPYNVRQACDLECKARLMPSSTTFDVAVPSHPHRIRNNTNDDNIDEYLPAVATIMNKGLLVRSQMMPEVSTVDDQDQQYLDAAGKFSTSVASASSSPWCNNTFVDSVRQKALFDVVHFQQDEVLPSNVSTMLLGALSYDTKLNGGIFTLVSSGCGWNKVVQELIDPANDFSLNFGAASLVFAPKLKGQNIEPPFSIDLDKQQKTLHRNHGSIKSEILCVEHQYNSPTTGFYFGHRNGTISRIDPRCSKGLCTMGGDTSKNKKYNNRFGSVTKLLTNLHSGGNDAHVLAKGSFGSCCRLYDVRKIGQQKNHPASSALLRDFTVPLDLQHPSLSSTCSGLAVDPSGTALISPFVNKGETPCLGLWSLGTGEYVGSKELVSTNYTTSASYTTCPTATAAASDAGPTASATPGTYCELSSSITSAYSMQNYQVEKTNSMFGLWVKCGSVVPNAPPSLGSIHHVVMPGRHASDYL